MVGWDSEVWGFTLTGTALGVRGGKWAVDESSNG